MIAKIFRISRDRDFDLILKSKFKFYSKNFVLRLSKNGLDKSRFCVVVSKKISKKAVVRNKIRRRVYEILRTDYGKIKTGFDFMIFIKSGVLTMEFQEMQEEVMSLFEKAKTLL